MAIVTRRYRGVGANLAAIQTNGDPGSTLPVLGYTPHVDVTFDNAIADPIVVDTQMQLLGFVFETAAPVGSPLLDVSNALRVIERVGDPTAEPDTALVYSKDVGGITQLFSESSDGVVHQITPAGASANTFYFGDGSDGDVTIAVNTTLTRNMFYRNLTINPGISLIGPYVVCVSEVCQLDGTVRNRGAPGAPGLTGVGGGGGATIGAGTLGGVAGGGAGSAGIGGAAGVAAASGPRGFTAGTVTGTVAANGTNGGVGQGGSGGGNTLVAGFSSGAVTLALATLGDIHDIFMAMNGRTLGVATLPGVYTGGSGGGGGIGNAVPNGGGGGGGAGGGFTVLRANVILGAGDVNANGGAGGAGGPGTNGGSGGAGGGGGAVVVITSAATLAFPTMTATGGLGGAAGVGGVTGRTGGNGGDGLVFQFTV